MMRNPDWTRDELILALDLYIRAGRRWLEPSDPAVIELSAVLNQLPIHPAETRNANFRNAGGVSMKLGNILSIDPKYHGAGLRRGSKLDRAVWDEFEGDIYRLARAATSIKNTIKLFAEEPVSYEIDRLDEEFTEGRLLTYLHVRKERNRKVVKSKKAKVLRETGRLGCEVCGFDFYERYGELGQGFAECHHIVPIAEIEANHQTRLEELAIVCANCHRMLHRSAELLSIQELRTIVKATGSE